MCWLFPSELENKVTKIAFSVATYHQFVLSTAKEILIFLISYCHLNLEFILHSLGVF